MKKLTSPRKLRRLRDLVGLSQFQLHHETSIDRSRLSLLENGHAAPTGEELSVIMKVIQETHRRKVREFEELVGSEVA